MSEQTPKNPEIESAPHYAIPMNQLDEGTWNDILAIYMLDAKDLRLAPDDDFFLMHPVDKVRPGSGLRLGSRFSPHSKLEVKSKGFTPDEVPLLGFDFYINDALPPSQLEEAQTVQEKFRTDIDDYLQFIRRGVLTGD